MGFIDEMKGAYNDGAWDKKTAESDQFDWTVNAGAYYNAYNAVLHEQGKKPISYNDFMNKVHKFVGAVGVEDGKWTQEEFDANKYEDSDYINYANTLMPSIFGGVDPALLQRDDKGKLLVPITDAIKNPQKLTGEAKQAYDRVKKRYDELNYADRANKRWSDDNTVGDRLANVWNGAFDLIGTGWNAIWGAPYQNGGGMDKDISTLQNYVNDQMRGSVDILDNYEGYIQTAKANRQKNEAEEAAANKTEGGDNKNGGSGKQDVVEFTLTRGNDPNYKGFGQKLVDLGLATDNGLWGENGDVAYYTKQLNNQGIYGNLPIGKTIRLTRRK